jgi:signal transduction histidine kinase
VTSWPALLIWALTAGVLHIRGRRELVLAARARHEVRGPLCTAQLALDGLEPSARVTAIGMELRRAALALDDLAGPPQRAALAFEGLAPLALSALAGRARLERGGLVARQLSAPGQRFARGPGHINDLPAGVDVTRLLADAAPVWRSLAEARGAQLAVDASPAMVLGDPLRLAQACANLVTNAIEHGGGGHVRVTSYMAEGRVRIEVADDGPGLPAPLAQLLTAARGRRSARGHGLAIAAAIAELHGGRLSALPSARGACLALELPAARQAAARIARDSTPVP